MNPATDPLDGLPTLPKPRTETEIAEMLERYRNYLTMAACTMIPRSHRRRIDVDDMVQETLLKAQRAFHQFRGETEPQLVSWLRTVLQRTIIDHGRQLQTTRNDDLQRVRSMESVFAAESGIFSNLLAASGTSPSEFTHRRELGVVLADALASLPKQYQTVLHLRSLQELDWQEVADEMQRTVGSVRMLWARALIRLRPLLEEYWKKQ